MEEIRKGLESGLDVSIYADPKFTWQQMREIRQGLEAGVDANIYADLKFDRYQMEQIKEGLEGGVDVSIYADPDFDQWQMEEIREGTYRANSKHKPKYKSKQQTLDGQTVAYRLVDKCYWPEECAYDLIDVDSEYTLQDLTSILVDDCVMSGEFDSASDAIEWGEESARAVFENRERE